MDGGSADVILELKNLAVPFALILAKNGMDYIKTKSASKPKGTRGGCGCAATSSSPTLAGGSSCGMPVQTVPVVGGCKSKTCKGSRKSIAKSVRGGEALASELNSLASRLNNLVSQYNNKP